MDVNIIKKVLYKEKPIARLYDRSFAINGRRFYHYSTETSLGDILFNVPEDEMGENTFKDEESAQLLIRWLQV